MCTSWSSANQISNFKFSAFFRVLFALWSLKYPHPKSQQTPRVSTELEMVVHLSYSFIPFQKVSQKGVDRSVENRQKRAENIEMALNAPIKLSWRMRKKCPSAKSHTLLQARQDGTVAAPGDLDTTLLTRIDAWVDPSSVLWVVSISTSFVICYGYCLRTT